jgi:protease-4
MSAVNGPQSAGSPPSPQNSPSAPPLPPAGAPGYGQPWIVQAPKRSGGGWWKTLLVVCVVLAVFFGGFTLMASAIAQKLGGLATGAFDTKTIQAGESSQTVAVVEVNGLIDRAQAAMVESFCREVRGDKNVKAVVIRIDSGGGTVSDSDAIYEQFKRLKNADKTLVVSMGGVAASGGYYISAPADVIFAEPTTITGSIGVIAMWPMVTGSLEKLGAQMRVIRSAHAKAWKAQPNMFEEAAPYQLADVQEMLDSYQQTFDGIVKTNRGAKLHVTTEKNTYTGVDGKPFTIEETVPLNGRIYRTQQAIALGLVDKSGYLSDAIDWAADLASLKKPHVLLYRKHKAILEELGMLRADASLPVEMLKELQTPKFMMLWQAD